MALDCARLSDFLFRRTPNWDKKLAKDRFPRDYTYTGLYQTQDFEPFTGDTHTWDRIHVCMDNDDGCWDVMDSSSFTSGNCLKADMCAPTRNEIGWGSTRSNYGKYHRDYTTKPFCMDHLRHVEMAREQLDAIVTGLKALPDQISGAFLKLLALRQADFIHICSATNNFPRVTVTDSIFTNNCTRINLSSSTNLPTSKLTMQYLNHFAPTLALKGYFNQRYLEGDKGMGLVGKYQVMTDLQTQQELSNANPALSAMYMAADFEKGGKFFKYGVMGGVGDWLFKIDPMPLRFIALANGVLNRVWPYQNVNATVGQKPQFDPLYENAPYQISHIYSRDARVVQNGKTASVHPDMPFLTRNLMGRWSWKSPDAFQYRDPSTNTLCTYYNDKKNRGYFLGDYELGMKTIYPEIEMEILHLREPQAVADVPNSSTFNNPAPFSATSYQDLAPYNPGCDTSDEV